MNFLCRLISVKQKYTVIISNSQGKLGSNGAVVGFCVKSNIAGIYSLLYELRGIRYRFH